MKMKTTDQIVEHRLAILTVYNMLESRIPTAFRASLSRRVAEHDRDKQCAIAAGDEVAYSLHDFEHDHHVAFWALHPGEDIAVDAFLEHVCDHAAVNFAQEGRYCIDLDWFKQSRAFDRDSFLFGIKGLPCFQVARKRYELRVTQSWGLLKLLSLALKETKPGMLPTNPHLQDESDMQLHLVGPMGVPLHFGRDSGV